MNDELFMVIDTVGIYLESVDPGPLPFFLCLFRKCMLRFSAVRR